MLFIFLRFLTINKINIFIFIFLINIQNYYTKKFLVLKIIGIFEEFYMKIKTNLVKYTRFIF